jgi:hypothetical protein
MLEVRPPRRESVIRILALGIAAAALLPAATTKVTFYQDVLPVLQKNCQNCHRPGESAPMSLLTYAEARPWAKAMKQAVLSRKMPPWFADAKHGSWANDRSLAEADRNVLIAWADSGAREGDSKHAPAPLRFTEGWTIGKPDTVFEMPAAAEVPAQGTIEYQYIVVPTGFTEDKWVQTAEARPGNRALVHHIIAFVREPGSKWMRDAQPGVPFIPQKKKDDNGRQVGGENSFGGEFLVGYAPGTVPETLAPGQAKLIKAGSDIVFQMHYTANGKAGSDRSRLGLIFAKEPPKERVFMLAVGTQKFVIPAGADNHRVDASMTLHADTTLVSLLPHMHLRGKAFEYRAVYPTGETEVLLSVPKYDFNWQLSYYPTVKKVLPKGTKIEATAFYDNSANNPANPDPKSEVRYGDQSWEEMMFGFFDVAFDASMNPRDVMRERKPAPAQTGE